MGLVNCDVPDDLSSAAMPFNASYTPKGKDSVKYIFAANYGYIVKLYNTRTPSGKRKIRDFCFDQIQKCILCGSVDLGYTVYECPRCGNFTIVPNRCHSRFCSSCAVKKARADAQDMANMALDCKHRHVVLTIPEELRDMFLADRKMLSLLFIAGRNTLYDIANGAKYRKSQGKKKKTKAKKRREKKRKSPYDYKDDRNRGIPGFIITLHTFGRDLKWNPHIHILCSEKYYDTKSDKMKSLYFPFRKIRKTWQYQLLKVLSESPSLSADPEFRKLRNRLYLSYPEGFYIHAPDRLPDIDEDDMGDNDFDKLTDNIKGVVGYITRYTSRPVIADSRIDSYDEESNTVTWHYTDHKDDETHTVTDDAETFIRRVIIHCPDKNFKMTRRYGYYSNAYSKCLDHIYEIYGKQIKRKLRTKSQRKKSTKKARERSRYRMSMILTYGKDPIKCTCGAIMQPTFSYNPYKEGKPNERQRRIKRHHDIIENMQLRNGSDRRRRSIHDR